MLNYLWSFMILAGVGWAALHGTLPETARGALEAAGEAVSLCVTMLGIMSLWMGILKIGERAGLIDRLAGRMAPVLRFLFPDIPAYHPANRSIAFNMIANMLGLGWAATPAGLKAMKELEELEEERRQEAEGFSASCGAAVHPAPRGIVSHPAPRGTVLRSASRGTILRPAPRGTASREMCTFLVINISSLQLIPMNMIAYRTQYGSGAPAAIVGPAIAATAVSTAVAVLFCKWMDGVGRRRAG